MHRSPVRVRFAPAPTGMMHLGNIRQAAINYLYARQHQGVFILRLEDTDQQRIFDVGGKHILQDLSWLGLQHDEGPDCGGPYAPYVQSQRTAIYTGYLAQLIAAQRIYRCFCTHEELERKRVLQAQLKQAPRYDRTCLRLSEADYVARVDAGVPFIWRFKLEPGIVILPDLAKGEISFDVSNFSDFPLTRQDGSFTFIFANCVDDISMHITHVFRGEEHLSNSVNQIMLYQAFHAPIPIFWHTPIICDKTGKKLSKRDFGFSLEDLRAAGFVPEAIINYLALLGGKALEQEILTLEELARAIDFQHHGSSGAIKYDADRLRWMNHEWIKRLSPQEIAHRCRPFLEAAYPAVLKLPDAELERMITLIQKELSTLADSVPLLHGYFHTPHIDHAALLQHHVEQYNVLLGELPRIFAEKRVPQEYIQDIKFLCQQHKLPAKDLWSIIRIILTGSAEGSSIATLIELIGHKSVKERLSAAQPIHTML